MCAQVAVNILKRLSSSHVKVASAPPVAKSMLYAHTSPVYVLLDGKPIKVKCDMTSMADYVRICMERYLPGGYYGGGQFSNDAQIRELMANCQKAIEFFERGIR